MSNEKITFLTGLLYARNHCLLFVRQPQRNGPGLWRGRHLVPRGCRLRRQQFHLPRIPIPLGGHRGKEADAIQEALWKVCSDKQLHRLVLACICFNNVPQFYIMCADTKMRIMLEIIFLLFQIADSMNFNPNKWMLVNFDASVLWYEFEFEFAHFHLKKELFVTFSL